VFPNEKRELSGGSGPPFSAAQLNVEPTGPSALLCSSPARGKFMFLLLATRPSSPPALRLVLSSFINDSLAKF